MSHTVNFSKASDYELRAKKYIWLGEIDGFEDGLISVQLAKLLDVTYKCGTSIFIK
jgi:hypothetical protein